MVGCGLHACARQVGGRNGLGGGGAWWGGVRFGDAWESGLKLWIRSRRLDSMYFTRREANEWKE